MSSQISSYANSHANIQSNALLAADQQTSYWTELPPVASVTSSAALEKEQENARLRLALREARHRTGNQWQQLIGLAELESTHSSQTSAAGGSARLRAMIHAFATLNAILEADGGLPADGQNVPVQTALESLLTLLQTTVEEDTLHFAVQDALLPEKGCAALMLICAELVCNAAKYGRKTIQITFHVQNQFGILEVRDDGPGFPHAFRVEEQSRQDLLLVQTLCRFDLNGEMRCHNHAQGGVVTLTFPVLPAPAAAVEADAAVVEADKAFCAMEGIICPENLAGHNISDIAILKGKGM